MSPYEHLNLGASDIPLPQQARSSVASGLRARVLLPVMVAIALLLAAFIVMFVREINHRRAEDLSRAAVQVNELTKTQLTEGIELMNSLMPLIMSDPRLVAALKARDRETLFALSEPILNDWRARNRITHFYFILPDTTMLLRVQHPEEWGDKIDRFVLHEAQRTGRPFWGNEQGPFGTLTLRVVHPWHSDGQLIGYFELGQEFEDIMRAVHDLLDVDVFIAIDKRFLDRAKWESRQAKFGGGVDWEEFPSVIVLSRTGVIPEPVTSHFSQLQDAHVEHMFEAAWDDRVAQSFVTPFMDVRGRCIGETVVMRDITAAAADSRRAVLSMVVVCTVIGGALVTLFHVLLGRVQLGIADRRARLTEAQEELQKSYALLRAFIDNSTAVIYVKDLEGRFILVNRQCEALFGVPGQTLVGKTDHDVFPKERADRFRAFDSQVLAVGKALEAEEVAPQDDGPHTYISLKCPLFDSDGKPYAICGISTDITERKHSEQRQQLMMRELDHRVKNNLAAVISLVDITWRSFDTVDAFRDSFIGRIHALARAHGLLAQTGWSGLAMHDLVRQTLEAFLVGEPQRVAIAGPQCTLPASAAAPLCMALHELATNAAKYGALSSAAGRIDLKWSIRGPHGTPTHLEVQWREEGGPAVTRPTRKGFGISLVENVIGYQLGGDVDLDFAPAGLGCTMTIDFSAKNPAWTPPGDNRIQDATSFKA